MFVFKSFLLAALVITGSQSFAGTVYLSRMGQSASLPECGGYVTLTRSFLGNRILKVEGNGQCSNIEINGMVYKSQDYERIVIGDGTTVARIHSNSGKHWDDVVIRLSSSYGARFSNTGSTWATLRECGGSAELITAGGQVNLVLRKVSQCSNFDIVDSNGESVNYPNTKIPGMNGNRSGSFTLPRSLYQYGVNGVHIKVQSNSGGHRDDLTIVFVAE